MSGLKRAGGLVLSGLSAAVKTVDALLGFPSSDGTSARQRHRLTDLERLNKLHQGGLLTDAELAAEKSRLLGGSS